MSLERQLADLPPALIERLRARGFSSDRLLGWARTIGVDRDKRNRLPGLVEPPGPGDITDAPVPGSEAHARLSAIGIEAIRRGEVALCVLAGGMATRMGGVVKALVEAIPGHTFLDLRLRENAALEALGGRPFPLWLMTSEATEPTLRAALGEKLKGDDLATFEQCVSLRLTPAGDLFEGGTGEHSVYATGHGDLPEALKLSGLLERFVKRGGKVVCIANVDNLGATVDPAIVGAHLDHGGPMTVELVDKVGSDRGGGPVRWNGRPIITEEFRLPIGFDPASVPVFNTNTFLASAPALLDLQMEWTYVEVEKSIGGQKAVQFERLLGEVTAALPSAMLRVPREGTRSRFLPVKDMPELEKRRPEIAAIVKDRGILS
ncbi:MAG: UTP--glucose-1-phosphate uridylyltransferase [Byssovorax sp.]